jgi:hypothetical protein
MMMWGGLEMCGSSCQILRSDEGEIDLTREGVVERCGEE